MVKDSDFDAGEALDEDAGKQKGSFGSLREYEPLNAIIFFNKPEEIILWRHCGAGSEN